MKRIQIHGINISLNIYYPLYVDLYKNVAVKLNETCFLLCVQELKKNLLSKLCLPVLVDF